MAELKHILRGDTVTGRYHGENFVGIVRESRLRWGHWGTQTCYHIDLINPMPEPYRSATSTAVYTSLFMEVDKDNRLIGSSGHIEKATPFDFCI